MTGSGAQGKTTIDDDSPIIEDNRSELQMIYDVLDEFENEYIEPPRLSMLSRVRELLSLLVQVLRVRVFGRMSR